MAIAADTPIPTPLGWYYADELKVGQLVFDRFGNATEIKSIQPYTPKEMFEVVCSDGSYVEGDRFLKINITTAAHRTTYRQHTGKRNFKRRLFFRTAKELFDGPLTERRNRLNYAINNVQPVHFYTEDHPVPPFIVGLWCIWCNKSNKFTLRTDMVEYVKAKIKESGWTAVHKEGRTIEIRPSILLSFLTKYQTIPTKLPIDYTFGSVEQRIEFLRGLFARLPYVYKKKRDVFEFLGRNEKFLNLIQGVCESLGIRAMLSSVPNTKSFNLTFKTSIQLVPHQEKKGSHVSYQHRLIQEVNKIPPKKCIHFETDKPIAVGQSYLSVWH